jgi:NarL family two-component system response regulator LiaR
MSVTARRIVASERARVGRVMSNGVMQAARVASEAKPRPEVDGRPAARLSVFVAADNCLLREALAHMLTKTGTIEVVGMESPAPLRAESVTQARPDVLLLSSRGTLNDDLLMIQQVRAAAPGVRILLLGMALSEAEFLRCVRAGISGYLLRDASADEVVDGVRAVHAGEAVCPGMLCTALFRYFESEAAALPCASARRRLGLTRREQQLIPLIAKGLTNKEIANHFSLSEQTVKNHLYRMKHKTGAEDRLDIVQLYRVRGFLV